MAYFYSTSGIQLQHDGQPFSKLFELPYLKVGNKPYVRFMTFCKDLKELNLGMLVKTTLLGVFVLLATKFLNIPVFLSPGIDEIFQFVLNARLRGFVL